MRDYWVDAARDFTPWLAKEENLGLLADTLGLSLELVGTEQRVGPFKADIVAKDGEDTASSRTSSPRPTTSTSGSCS